MRGAEPLISIIIPSFNQSEYLVEALESVWSQDYRGVEVIVVDGGSTDGTVEILREYERQLAWWVSEPDRGQTHAINKGLERMSGEVWMYLNSDDLLSPGALTLAAEAFADAGVAWVGGAAEVFSETGQLGLIRPGRVNRRMDYLRPWGREPQYVFPFSGASFMRRSVLEQVGGFDESLHYCMDIDYYLRAKLQHGLNCRIMGEVLARWRRHSESKTEREGLAYGFREEEIVLARRYLHNLSVEERVQVQQELVFEERQTLARKACHFADLGRIEDGRTALWQAVVGDPGLLGFRPWWGAVRRCLWAK